MFFIKKNGICISIMIVVVSLATLPGIAQNKKPVTPGDTARKAVPATAADSARKMAAANMLVSMKTYREVVPSTARTMHSFFKVHIVKDRYLLEIPDSLLQRDILAVTRIKKGADRLLVPGVLGYGGDELGRAMIRFGKIPGDKLAMRSIKPTLFDSDTSANGLSKALAKNNEQVIEAVFPIKAVNKIAGSTVIDMTDFLNSRSMATVFTKQWEQIIGSAMPDRSYIDKVIGFPDNIEIAAVKTVVNATMTYTIEVNTSLIILPRIPMQARLKDPRVGYSSNDYTDLDKDPRGLVSTRYIQRWRMEPKAEDRDKYLRGELVEPKKPVVIYIDPATPKKWVPYLIAGINDWQAAFEKAGFKNAIRGMEAPQNDSTWNIDDARHSAIIYKPSPIPNATGPNVNDPRSGEILETHINWYHQVLSMIQNWYTVQAGAVDPRTHQPELDDALMGQLIRFVSSHEVGHALGLAHNFGASSTVPVAKLRDKAWVEAHGHTPSIMDYARFNYVAQPEDHIGDKGMFPHIGDYDKWAIEWGYKWLPQFKNTPAERPYLNKWIVGKLASGKQYFYGSQLEPITDAGPPSPGDPRDQSEDLGDDAMLASTYGIKNLKRIMPHLTEWFRKPDEPYLRPAAVYTEILTEYSRFIGHVRLNIGGIYATPKTVEQHGPEYEITPKAKQQRAMAFLQNELFTTPYWLKNDKLFSKSQVDFSTVNKLQILTLRLLMQRSLIEQLLSEETRFPGKAYTAVEMLNDLKRGIFSELPVHRKISTYRRDLQNQYVAELVFMLKQGGLGERQTLISMQARSLAAELKRAAATGDALTREHLRLLSAQLHAVLDPKNIINSPEVQTSGSAGANEAILN